MALRIAKFGGSPAEMSAVTAWAIAWACPDGFIPPRQKVNYKIPVRPLPGIEIVTADRVRLLPRARLGLATGGAGRSACRSPRSSRRWGRAAVHWSRPRPTPRTPRRWRH
jgi:hypothetical protein